MFCRNNTNSSVCNNVVTVRKPPGSTKLFVFVFCFSWILNYLNWSVFIAYYSLDLFSSNMENVSKQTEENVSIKTEEKVSIQPEEKVSIQTEEKVPLQTEEKVSIQTEEKESIVSEDKETGDVSTEPMDVIVESATEVVKKEEETYEEKDLKEKQPESNLEKKENNAYTIFVGKLVDRVTADVLKSFFVKETKSTDEEILSVNIPCKVVKKTKRLGIAFVDFANARAYEAALALNNTALQGQNILVLPAAKTHEGLLLMDGPDGEADENKAMKSKDSPNSEYVPVYKKSDHVAYIKNLPNGVSEDEVLEFFKVTRADIVDIAIPLPFKGKRNAKRPVRAIIAFPSEEALQNCLDQTKSQYRDREVVVERHQMVPKVIPGEKRPVSCEGEKGEELSVSPEKQLRISNTTNSSKTSGSVGVPGQLEMDLFVKHIPREASDRQIKDFFSSVGATVTKVNLFSESVTGSTRGMGFVSMFNKDSLKRGLLLDCKRFYKNKVRISVRRDRDQMVQLDKAEMIPNYSTFVGNLPIREKAEILKQALLNHFKSDVCSVNEVYVPLANNRSGNRGYAFITFENEASLKESQNKNNSELKLDGGNTKISVSDRWPENPSDSGDKGKGRNIEQGPHTAQDSLGKLRKRKKGMLPPMGAPGFQGYPGPRRPLMPPGSLGPFRPRGPSGPNGAPGSLGFRGPTALNGPQGFRRLFGPNRPHGSIAPPGPSGPLGPSDKEGPCKQDRWNRFSSDGPEFGSFDQEPPDYFLDYLEYRDYVAMRKAFDERQDFIEFHASRSRFRNEGDDFSRQQLCDLPEVQSQEPSSFSRQVHKDGQMEEGLRHYSSYQTGDQRNRSGYEDKLPIEGHESSHSRDYRDFEFMETRGGGGSSGVFSNTGSGGGVGSGGNSFIANEQHGGSAYNLSDTFSSSLNSSRYQTADSSISRSRLFDNSAISTSSLELSRDNVFRDSSNANDTSRGRGNSSFNSGYVGGSGDADRGFLSTTGVSPNLRSSSQSLARPQYGPSLYSDRDKANSFSGGLEENSGFSTLGGGSYSGKDLNQRYSYSSGASQGDRRYSGYSDFGDQQRKGSQYDHTSSESRFGSSGLTSNAGYDGYSGLSGYRVG